MTTATRDVVVVGAGIFGATIASELRRLGADVTVIDANLPGSGSAPSAGLIKPSWYSGMRETYKTAMDCLERNWTVWHLNFRIDPISSVKRTTAEVLHVSPGLVMERGRETRVIGKVTKVESGKASVTVRYKALGDEVFETTIKAKRVVIAAGVWSADLAPVPGLQGKAGVSFAWRGAQLDEPFIRPWAPYKQILGFNIASDRVWVGDGTALLGQMVSADRAEQSRERCAEAAGLSAVESIPMYGVRPFIKGAKPAWLQQTSKGVWVATGGAKNGMLGAGYVAHLLGEEFR